MVITQSDLRQKHMFYKYAHIAGSKGSSDMILSAFHLKFITKPRGYLPGPIDPPNKIKTQTNHQQMASPRARPPEREVRCSQPPGKNQKGDL